MKASDIKFIVVHCAATQPKQDIGAAEIDRMHRERGFLKIGYHFVIRRNGKIEEGRRLWEVGAHAEGYNTKSLGICMVGGINAKGKADNNFVPEQFATLNQLIEKLRAIPGIPADVQVLGHRDLSPDLNGDGRIDPWEFKKECPSFDVRAWRESLTKPKEK